MKVIYKEPTICEQLDKLIYGATQPIQEFRLSFSELSEFCDEVGTAFNKQLAYTYKRYVVRYDWSSE